MSSSFLPCPHCSREVERYRNPAPTVDAVIYDPARGIVLVERKGEPLGYALPGGFVDYGETTEAAILREAMEETCLAIQLTGLLGVYSIPSRDPRSHTMSVIYVAKALDPDTVQGGDDAASAAYYPLDALPPLVFDHEHVVNHFKGVLCGSRTMAGIAYPA